MPTLITVTAGRKIDTATVRAATVSITRDPSYRNNITTDTIHITWTDRKAPSPTPTEKPH